MLPQEFFKALITHTVTNPSILKPLLFNFHLLHSQFLIKVEFLYRIAILQNIFLIDWNFSIPSTGGEWAETLNILHILQGCYYLPLSWKGTRLYQTLVWCFQITWNGFIKVEKVKFVDVQNLWSIHIESIWIKSVLEVSNIWYLKKFLAIKHHRSFHSHSPWHHCSLGKLNCLIFILYVNVLSSTDEAVRRRSPYSKLCETSRHCLMFTQTLSFLTNNVLVPGLCQQEEVYYVIKMDWKLHHVSLYSSWYIIICLLVIGPFGTLPNW